MAGYGGEIEHKMQRLLAMLSEKGRWRYVAIEAAWGMATGVRGNETGFCAAVMDDPSEITGDRHAEIPYLGCN